MRLDARDETVCIDRHVDLAIVGAGVAGLTLARELSNSAEVLLIESGGSEITSDLEALNQGENLGIPYPISETRTRQFGGSTSLWAGYCAQFDAQDFLTRDWVPRSGWPFDEHALSPYYRKAARLLNIRDFNFDARNIASRSCDEIPFDDDDVLLGVWRFGTPTLRLNEEVYEQSANPENVTALIHATVTDIRLDTDHSSVNELVIRTMNGREGRVVAERFVIACGGIETARMLLNADSQVQYGLGNSHDIVGRCFMEHPHLQIESLIVEDTQRFRCFLERGTYEDENPFLFNLGISADAQAQAGLLNFRVHVYRTPDMRDGESALVGVFLEQAPNPASRITLSSKSDALGLRRVQLDWRLTDLEWKTFSELEPLIARAFEKMGVQRDVHRAVRRDNKLLLHSNHHLGTTRMADSPSDGVVDANGRVHDISNLYVIGGSVFPTASWANPTFTLMALTLRLAEHLRAIMSGENGTTLCPAEGLKR